MDASTNILPVPPASSSLGNRTYPRTGMVPTEVSFAMEFIRTMNNSSLRTVIEDDGVDRVIRTVDAERSPVQDGAYRMAHELVGQYMANYLKKLRGQG